VDKSNNIYLTGSFEGTDDFDPNSGLVYLTSSGNSTHDIFISKLNSVGDFMWAKRVGGQSEDASYSMTINDSNRIFITGQFTGEVDFDPAPSLISNLTSINNSFDIFISEFDALGNFKWGGSMGSKLQEEGNAISIKNGAIYLTGDFSNSNGSPDPMHPTDFDPGEATCNLSPTGAREIFICKFNIICQKPDADITGDSIICKGTSAILKASGLGNYYWNTLDTDEVITVMPDSTTTYKLIVSNKYCSNSDTAFKNVIVHQAIASTTIGSTHFCKGDSITLIASGGKHYLWYNNQDTSSIKVLFSSQTTYYVIITDSNNCGIKDSVILPSPIQAEFFMSQQPASILTPTVYFTDHSMNASNWEWNFGNSEPSLSFNQNPDFTFSEIGEYNVQLIASDSIGCRDTVTHKVLISPDFAFYIPNAFTPDGDGINETFLPKGTGISFNDYTLDIYDRLGEKVFSSNNLSEGWDGKVHGAHSESGVYTYVINARDYLNRGHNFTGNITLLR
jgi:gliding motility-associated-like protein